MIIIYTQTMKRSWCSVFVIWTATSSLTTTTTKYYTTYQIVGESCSGCSVLIIKLEIRRIYLNVHVIWLVNEANFIKISLTKTSSISHKHMQNSGGTNCWNLTAGVTIATETHDFERFYEWRVYVSYISGYSIGTPRQERQKHLSYIWQKMVCRHCSFCWWGKINCCRRYNLFQIHVMLWLK
jgi:hypothetical protein